MINIFFLVDGPVLEAQATLLAATLAHANDDRFQLIAYAPDRHRDVIQAETCALFERCGVSIRPLPPGPRDWKKPYPHGNKILAAAAPRSGEWSLFLDTDMICVAPLDLAPHLLPRTVTVVPEGVPTWGKEDDVEGGRWARAYGHFGLPLPKERVQLTRRKRREFLPYFNAGMVAFPEGPLQDGRGLGALWLDTALDIDWNLRIGGKRPWLDQIALPLTLARFRIPYRIAPAELNFSISSRSQSESRAPVLVHYHRLRFLKGWPERETAFRALEASAGQELFGRLMDRFGADYDPP